MNTLTSWLFLKLGATGKQDVQGLRIGCYHEFQILLDLMLLLKDNNA
jgi:hypothetical protein